MKNRQSVSIYIWVDLLEINQLHIKNNDEKNQFLFVISKL